MTLAAEAEAPAATRELVLTRLIDASPEALYRCWTEPRLLKQWFAPAPLTTPHAELDVRVGGENLVVMKLPDGTESPNRGVYLEVVPGRKLVFTDAYGADWQPKDGAPFMTVILTFEDAGPGKARYTARVRHWTNADRARHEAMGFQEGWGLCADQLAALAKTL
ncbi:MAG TPA: SRPBCC family protein [Caulobacteraceae bacterium]|jgi:uncharacterized protein YndB with AHSA1/START domain